MAFGGLYYKGSNGNKIIETDSFKKLVSKQADRDNIKNIIINECQ